MDKISYFRSNRSFYLFNDSRNFSDRSRHVLVKYPDGSRIHPIVKTLDGKSRAKLIDSNDLETVGTSTGTPWIPQPVPKGRVIIGGAEPEKGIYYNINKLGGFVENKFREAEIQEQMRSKKKITRPLTIGSGVLVGGGIGYGLSNLATQIDKIKEDLRTQGLTEDEINLRLKKIRNRNSIIGTGIGAVLGGTAGHFLSK